MWSMELARQKKRQAFERSAEMVETSNCPEPLTKELKRAKKISYHEDTIF